MVLKRAVFLERGMKNGRKPSRFPTDSAGQPLRITQYIPMKLKPVTVEALEEKASRVDKNDVVCLPEMMNLFDCLSKHEFDKNLCKLQATTLQTCYSNFLEAKKKAHAQSAEFRRTRKWSTS